MNNRAAARVNRSAGLASAGLGANLLWCTLAGHTGGFPSSLHDLDPAVNPRLFFLLGILAVGIAFALAPRWLRERDRPFSYVLPLASSVGTACFALASNQSLFDPIVLAVAGLVIFGAGYFWIASRFYLLLTRTQTFACTAWCIVAALATETLVLPIVREAVPSVWQIVITIALPLVSAALLKGARTAATGSDALELQPRRAELPKGHEGRRSLMVLVAAGALLLATVRSFSSIGLWGNEAVAAQGLFAGLLFSLVSTALLALFAYATLVKTTQWRLDLRFQPAFIFVIGGLFVVVSQTSAQGIPAALLDAFMRLDDSCAHLLFWMVVVTAVDALTMPSYRVMGIAAAVYALSSILWVALLGSGVAFSMGTWQMRPANRPMMSACPTFGLVRMMARQYMAMMKFGFMPIDESSEPTVSLSTAPAASSTAMRMRSWVVRPAFFCGAVTSRLRPWLEAAPAVWVATSRLICCSMFLNPFFGGVPAGLCPSRGVWFAGTNFADEDEPRTINGMVSAAHLPQ